jgi:glycosyltransferase involved in cell wall biosynthesis
VAGERGGRPYLSIVIPAYNEEARLGDSLRAILRYVGDAAIHAELLVVDDGSTDGTARIAASALQGHPGRVLSLPENRGKGCAVRRGVLDARGAWVLMTDADLSTPIEEHARLAAAARDHDLDLAIGSRALPESKIEVRQHPVRETMGKSFNLLMRTATGLPFRDTQCGFKLIDRERTRPLFERMVVDRFAFDVELLFLCVRFGLRVRELPVVWRDSRGSQVSLVTDPINMLYDVARVRWRFRRGLYNPEPDAEAEGGAS